MLLIGPSASTQVSLLAPPRCIDTTVSVEALEYRVNPPGITEKPEPLAQIKVLSTTGLGSNRPSPHTGAVLSFIWSCATNSPGALRIFSRNDSRAAASSLPAGVGSVRAGA